MTLVSEKRTLDPEIIHQVWLAISTLLKQFSVTSDDSSIIASSLSYSVPISSLISYFKDNKDGSSIKKGSETIDSIVQQIIKEGLVYCNKSPAITATQQNGLLNGNSPTTGASESVVSLPLEANKCKHSSATKTVISNDFPNHDWYCFECHLNGGNGSKSVVECTHCWRVYHSSCVQAAHDFAVKLDTESGSTKDNASLVIRARNFTCPVCVLSQKYSACSVGTRKFSQSEFNQILNYAYQRFRAKSSQISRSLLRLKELTQAPYIASLSSAATGAPLTDSGTSTNGTSTLNELTTQLALQHLSFRSVDLSDIERKLDQCEYGSIGEFIGDCLSFRHMIEVTVIAAAPPEGYQKRRIRDTLTRMLDACRYDLKEMLGCVDCYQNSNLPTSNRHWFCRPCDPPHMLVFAKQKGYPYWPAKVINPRRVVDIDSCSEFDVRFFGANHERSIIDNSNIKDINSSLSELCITKPNSSLEKALAELRIHRDMLEKFEKGTLDMDESGDLEDSHKIKRTYNRRNNNALKRSKDTVDDNDTLSDSSSSSAAIKHTNDSNNTAKPAQIRSRSRTQSSRRNTTESEESVTTKTKKLKFESKTTVTDEESNDMFEDAKEELVNGVKEDGDDDAAGVASADAGDDDAATDVDEKTDDDDDVVEESKTVHLKSKSHKPNTTTDEEEDEEEDETKEAIGVKRGRGRPRKYFPEEAAPFNRNVSPTRSQSDPKDRRIRRSKVLYSPQTNKNKPLISAAVPVSVTSVPPVKSTRGRKPRLPNSSSVTISVPTSTPVIAADHRTTKTKSLTRSRRGRSVTTATLSPIKSPVRSISLSPVKATTSRANQNKASVSPTRLSPAAYKIAKITEKAQRRKQNIERQRQLIQARRKLKLRREQEKKDSALPRHIPPVTATKSSPAFNPSASNSVIKSISSPMISFPKAQTQLILNRSYMRPIQTPNMIPTPREFSTTSFNTPLFNFAKNHTIESNLFPIPNSQIFNSFVPQLPAGPALQPSVKPVQPVSTFKPPPSSVLKPIVGGEEVVVEEESNDSNAATKPDGASVCGNSETNSSASTVVNGQSNNQRPRLISSRSVGDRSSVDDTDEEPYLYDDDQLEEQINEYLAYQEEKESFEKQQQMQLQLQLQQQMMHTQQLQQQNLYLQHQLQLMSAANRPQPTTPNGFLSPMAQSPMPPATPTKPLEAPVKYLEYSSSSIYLPTKRNQTLANAYLHQINNNTFPSTKSDYLSQLVLRKDEFDASMEAESALAANSRKRGRPPKSTGDEVVDRSAKAKSIVEKSYLQESSCDRACLNKNIKSFKRFREFVESQIKDDNTKFKKEIETLKQEVYRLKNQKESMESELKQEKEKSKRCDPQLMLQLEARHQRQIAEIKRKLWCANCDAEASYLCCFNTNYCSPQCQNKHWIAGHKNQCPRSRTSNLLVNNHNSGSTTTCHNHNTNTTTITTTNNGDHSTTTTNHRVENNLTTTITKVVNNKA